MKRFNFDEEDSGSEVNFYDHEPPESENTITPDEYRDILEQELTLFEAKLQHMEQRKNHILLRESIQILKNSFWWKFHTVHTRLDYIDKTFNKLKELIKFEKEE